jgi:hypothetical protein
VQDFADFSQRILETLESPSPEVKSEVIRLLVDHIVVENDTIVIHHIVPISENERLSPSCFRQWILLQSPWINTGFAGVPRGAHHSFFK